VKQLDGTGLKRLHRSWRRRSGGRLALVLDDVEGPFNVGGIIRTAAALRVEDCWVSGRTPEPGDTKVAKTALGTDRYLAFHRTGDVATAIAGARAAGYVVVALELADEAVPLHEVATGADTCLVVGHEDRGLAAASLTACDVVAYVPLLGRVGSLNVATATAIALYELRRQQWSSPGDAATDQVHREPHP
jgi:tRNA (guanosine-2'-O-)-methyltransferase